MFLYSLSDELVTYVKHELQDRGFRSYDFALLPTDFGHGSRELLLAIGWLMCKEHTIDRFIMKCTAPLDDGIPNGSTVSYIGIILYMGRVTKLWLSCYLVLLSIDSKTR